MREYLNIPTLTSRRIEIDQKFFNAVLNGIIDAPDILSTIPFRIPYYSTRTLTSLLIPIHTTSYSQYIVNTSHASLSISNNIILVYIIVPMKYVLLLELCF